ncbi:ATP-binding protein, partial [Enterobacter hormaechei]|uniref:ATP-binding protein n=1 Tax=Enterobacter hormaechei TaxID=158836 RepID=UPI003BE33B9B
LGDFWRDQTVATNMIATNWREMGASWPGVKTGILFLDELPEFERRVLDESSDGSQRITTAKLAASEVEKTTLPEVIIR